MSLIGVEEHAEVVTKRRSRVDVAEQQQAAMTEEQSADFSYLSSMVGDEPLPGGDEPMAGDVDQAQQWAMVPAMLGSVLSMFIPEAQRVYSREACEAWGAAMVPVAEKYGWNSDGLMGPEVALFAASLPLAVGTFALVKAKRAEVEAKEAPAAAQKPAGGYAEPGSDTVVIGAPLAAGEA